jgi:hypothetical protein
MGAWGLGGMGAWGLGFWNLVNFLLTNHIDFSYIYDTKPMTKTLKVRL